MNENPVRWFEIYVKDAQRAKAFYEKTFGIKLEKLPDPSTEIQEMWMFPSTQGAAGAAGALVKMEGGPDGGSSSVIVYFGCEDCAVEARRVPEAGGKVTKPKFSIGQYGFIALATDTEGNMIGLHSMK